MQLISAVTVGAGGAASIDFTSIPNTFTDLCLMLSIRANGTDGSAEIRFNSSASTFTLRGLYGTGNSGVANWQQTSTGYFGQYPTNNQTSNTFGNAQIYIPNYASADNKTFGVDLVTENNASNAFQFVVAGRWANTSAITSIQIYAPFSTNIGQNSTAYLYGILKGSGGATVS